MSVQIPAVGPAYARTRRTQRIYDQTAEPASAVRADRRPRHPGRPIHDDLARWLAVAALALVTILFVLIVLQ